MGHYRNVFVKWAALSHVLGIKRSSSMQVVGFHSSDKFKHCGYFIILGFILVKSYCIILFLCDNKVNIVT